MRESAEAGNERGGIGGVEVAGDAIVKGLDFILRITVAF